MRLKWERRENGWCAGMGQGKLAIIIYAGHNKYRPWALTMQSPAACKGSVFEARFRTLREARMVASAMHDA